MLSDLISSGFSPESLIDVLLSIPVILFALTVHEASHGYVAYLLGDRTAANFGRLSLNPIKHLDLMGTLCMFLFGFGWAKPVPVNSRNFKNPKWGMALTAVAGPVSNILLSYIFFILAVLFEKYIYPLGMGSPNVVYFVAIYQLLSVGCLLNLSLAVFNLLPIPPLDGSRLLFTFLPAKYYFKVMQYERIIYYVVIALLVTGVLTVPLSALVSLILRFFNFTVGWMA